MDSGGVTILRGLGTLGAGIDTMEDSNRNLDLGEGQPSASAQVQKKQSAEAVARSTRPLRIVMVNDQPSPMEVFDLFIREWFEDVEVVMFENGADALEELSRTEPDLLITDDNMPRMTGEDLCRRLLDRKVAYPIIVNSPWEPTQEWVRELATGGLNVAFLPLPCNIADLRSLIEANLKVKILSEESHQPVENTGQCVRTKKGGSNAPRRKDGRSGKQPS